MPMKKTHTERFCFVMDLSERGMLEQLALGRGVTDAALLRALIREEVTRRLGPAPSSFPEYSKHRQKLAELDSLHGPGVKKT